MPNNMIDLRIELAKQEKDPNWNKSQKKKQKRNMKNVKNQNNKEEKKEQPNGNANQSTMCLQSVQSFFGAPQIQSPQIESSVNSDPLLQRLDKLIQIL